MRTGDAVTKRKQDGDVQSGGAERADHPDNLMNTPEVRSPEEQQLQVAGTSLVKVQVSL